MWREEILRVRPGASLRLASAVERILSRYDDARANPAACMNLIADEIASVRVSRLIHTQTARVRTAIEDVRRYERERTDLFPCYFIHADEEHLFETSDGWEYGDIYLCIDDTYHLLVSVVADAPCRLPVFETADDLLQNEHFRTLCAVSEIEYLKALRTAHSILQKLKLVADGGEVLTAE